MSTYTHWDEHGDDGCGGDGSCDSIQSEPDCVEGLSHSWSTEDEGGCNSNPGVWSLGGTTYRFAAHCRYCGVHRVEILHGSQRNPYECDSVEYEAGEPDQAAVASELRRCRRNRRASAKRRAAAIAHYGSVDAWRAAVRARRAEVLRRNLGLS